MAKSSVSFREKFGSASGDFAASLYFGIVMNCMSHFYTDVFGNRAASSPWVEKGLQDQQD